MRTVLPQPKSIGAWVALPELPMGDYEVLNVGLLDGRLKDLRKHALPDLPPRHGDETGLAVHLANVEVNVSGKRTMFRLPLLFGSIARQMYEEGGRHHAMGQRLVPSWYRFGIVSGNAFVEPIDPPASTSN